MSRVVRRRVPWRSVAVLIAAIIVLLRAWEQTERRHAPSPSRDDRSAGSSNVDARPIADGYYDVQRVVDGDTLVLVGGERVRLKGMNTPETVKPDHPVEPWGPEASDFTREFVSGGRVRLEIDREGRDDNGRVLAFVWVGNRMLNEELVRAGLARATARFPLPPEMRRRLAAAQDEARKARRGIWSGPSDR